MLFPTKPNFRTFASLGLCAITALFSAYSVAATPTAYLENAQVFANGKRITGYRMPTVDANGKVQYFNFVIDLSVLNDGKMDVNNLKASTWLSPNLSSNAFIPGNYVFGSVTCTVATTVLPAGRAEASISCKNSSNNYVFQANGVSGLIPGHPFELDLKVAGIDKIPAYNNYSWGKIGNTTNDWDWWNCMSTNDIISLRQVGNTLSIGGYDDGNKQNCGVVLTKK